MRSLQAVLLIAFAAVACGDGDKVKPLPDGPVFPDAPDAATDGPVKLTITVGTTPQEGVTVYFQNADSSVVSATSTDASGVATAVMEPGGFVTAVNPFPGRAQGISVPKDLRTFAGVKPGDQLVLHANDPNPVGITFDLATTREPTGNAASYQLLAPCLSPSFGLDITNGASGSSGSGSGTPGGSITLFGCTSPTDLTVVTRDGNGLLLNGFSVPNVDISTGTVDLTSSGYTAVESANFNFTNLPDDFSNMEVAGYQLTPHGIAFETFDFNPVTSNAASALNQLRPAILNAQQVTFSRFSGPSLAFFDVLEWGPATTDYTLSGANLFVHEYATSPAWDFGINGVLWTTDNTAGKQPDFVRLRASFQRAQTTSWFWEIVAPGDATSVGFPQLPSPDDDTTPLSTDDFQSVDSLTTGTAPGGYDAVRPGLLIEEDAQSGVPVNLVLGATGRVVFEELSFGKIVSGKTGHRMWSPFAPSPRRRK